MDGISVAEAASRINDAHLLRFLDDLRDSSESKRSKDSKQMMQLVDYFSKFFADVNATQFPWPKMFQESHVDIILDIPLCYISKSIYNASISWIAKCAPNWPVLPDFVLWCLDEILANLASEKSIQHSPSKAQVEIFVVLALTLRALGYTLFPLLSTLRDNPKYQGQEQFPVIVWLIGQASVEESIIGFRFSVHYFFPLILENSSLNGRSRNLALQLIERISSTCVDPRLDLLDFQLRERLVPASSLDLLMRAAFPAPSSWTMESVRFVRIYHCFKQVALATYKWDSDQRKKQKLLSEQLLPYAVRGMQESDNPKLAQEATDLLIWCIAHNDEGRKHWENLKLENEDVSSYVLVRMLEVLSESSLKLARLKTFWGTLQKLYRRRRHFSWTKTTVLLSVLLVCALFGPSY